MIPRVRPIFAWYDLWIGVFIDTAKRRLYVLPLPCVGLVFEWPAPAPAPYPGPLVMGCVTQHEIPGPRCRHCGRLRAAHLAGESR